MPTVATEWIEPGDTFVLPATEFVLKPTIGAGSKGAGRFDPDRADGAAAAAAHLADLHASGRTVMVQPYLGEVDRAGEAALIYLGGRFSHAVTKQALLAPGAVFSLDPAGPGDRFVTETMSDRVASMAERRVADSVLAYLEGRFAPLLYARIDLLPSPSGPTVIEVEVIEPSLFLSFDANDPGAADRMAAAVADELHRV